MSVLKDSVARALNEQANSELASSNIYLAISFWFAARSFTGSAHWMKLQAEEERSHAYKIWDHISKRQSSPNGVGPSIQALSAVEFDWKTPTEIWAFVKDHEREVTNKINALVALAETEKDYATRAFLDWFVTEQVEEEATVAEIYDKAEAMGSIKGLYFHLDKSLSKRKE